jgi:hypothetical protein
MAATISGLTAEQSQRLATWKAQYNQIGVVIDYVYALHGWRVDEHQAKRLIFARWWWRKKGLKAGR